MLYVDILMVVSSILASKILSVNVLQIAQDSNGASDTIITQLQGTSVAILFHQACTLVNALVVMGNSIKTILPKPRMIWLQNQLILGGHVIQKYQVSFI